MNKQEIIEAFCQIISKVGSEVFHSTVEHDCICGQNELAGDRVVVNEKVIQFIQDAVENSIKAKKNFDAYVAKKSIDI